MSKECMVFLFLLNRLVKYCERLLISCFSARSSSPTRQFALWQKMKERLSKFENVLFICLMNWLRFCFSMSSSSSVNILTKFMYLSRPCLTIVFALCSTFFDSMSMVSRISIFLSMSWMERLIFSFICEKISFSFSVRVCVFLLSQSSSWFRFIFSGSSSGFLGFFLLTSPFWDYLLVFTLEQHFQTKDLYILHTRIKNKNN